jgi:hypothetical protein
VRLIHYKKVCSVEDVEVPANEVVRVWPIVALGRLLGWDPQPDASFRVQLASSSAS